MVEKRSCLSINSLISDQITDINVQIPRGAQVGLPTMVIVNVLSKNHEPNFGLVHYVWNFGDTVSLF